VLPLTCLTIGSFAVTTMLTKNTFVEEIRKQYVLVARAKGLSQRRVLYKHVFRNALIPLVTGFPAAFVGAFFAGSVLIETLFSLDGLGLLGYEAVIRRDYPVVLGSLYLFTLIAPGGAADLGHALRADRPARAVRERGEMSAVIHPANARPGRRRSGARRHPCSRPASGPGRASGATGWGRCRCGCSWCCCCAPPAEVVSNDKPFVARIDGQWWFPAIDNPSEKTLGGDFLTPTDWKDPFITQRLAQPGNWAIGAPNPHSATSIDYFAKQISPGAPNTTNWLGTDSKGRDMLARLIYGFRVSIWFGSR
jgi:hypothetical protein